MRQASGEADQARMRSVALAFCAARAGIGASIILAPKFSSLLLGFPQEQDNATARFAGRLFGVRELALAGYTAGQVQKSVHRPDVYLANAAVDVGDFAVSLLTLLGRRGIPRAAFGSAALALPFAAAFLWLRGSCQD
jgi:hypothetical protein